MQHKTLEQLQRVAEIHPGQSKPAMTRRKRLARWAELLEKEPHRRLATLSGTEYQFGDLRDSMRSGNSPLSVAHDDPILRAEGLAGDAYGDAKRFFELSDRQLHDIVCYCHHGVTMTAENAARRVRAAIGGAESTGMFARLRDALAG